MWNLQPSLQEIGDQKTRIVFLRFLPQWKMNCHTVDFSMMSMRNFPQLNYSTYLLHFRLSIW